MARPPPKSTPGQWALKSSRQKRASMNFLRGGMKPRADGIAAPVAAGETGAVASVVCFAFAAPDDAAPVEAVAAAPCADACDDTAEGFFVAALSCEEAAEAEEPGAAVAFDAAALAVGAALFAAPFCVGAAAADDVATAGADLAAFSVPAGDGEVAGSAAAAAGFIPVAGFAAFAAVPEPEGAAAVAVAAFTAC